jgi:hypothetical protein
VAELVDAADSKSAVRKGVKVRFLSWAPNGQIDMYRFVHFHSELAECHSELAEEFPLSLPDVMLSLPNVMLSLANVILSLAKNHHKNLRTVFAMLVPLFRSWFGGLFIFLLHLIVECFQHVKCFFLFPCFRDQAFAVPEILEVWMRAARRTKIGQYPRCHPSKAADRR